MNDFNIRRSEPSLVLLNQSAGFPVPLHSIHNTLRSLKRRLYTHGAGSRPHVIDYGIPGKLQLGYGKAADLTLGHGGFSPQEFSVVNTGPRGAKSLPVLNQGHAKPVIASCLQLCRCSGSNFLFCIPEPFPYMHLHPGQSVFLQLPAQIRHAACRAEQSKCFPACFYRMNQIGITSVGAFQTHILPCKSQPAAEIYDRRNTAQAADFTALPVQRVVEPFCSAVKTDIA